MLNEHDKIKELFSEKLGNFQAPVNPELWTSIASKIGTTATVATSTSIVVKTIIGVAAASVVVVGTYLALNTSDPVKPSLANETTTQNKGQIDQTPIVQNVEDNKFNNFVENEPSDIEDVSANDGTLGKNNTTSSTEKRESNSTNKSVGAPFGGQIGSIDGVVIVPEVNEKKEVLDHKKVITKEENKTTTSSTKGSSQENAGTQGSISESKEPAKPMAEITFLPNVITPNGDNVNDVLFIEYSGELLDFSLVVLNSKNEIVFETKDPDFNWRGELRSGEIATDDVYVCVIVARDINGKSIKKYQRLSINPK